MRSRRFTFPCLLAAAIFAATFARADEPTPSPLRKPEPVSVQKWGESYPNCAEWTNACIICKRNEVGVAACSTPGIACQPKEISCSRQVEKKR